MASEYTSIGRVAPYYRGEWSASAAYTRLDIVSAGDRTKAYIARKDVPAGTALTDETCWAMVLDVSALLDTVDGRTAAALDAAVAAAEHSDDKAGALYAEASGNPMTISADPNTPVRAVVTIAPDQSGSGTPSATNIRPFAGRTGAVVAVSGKNLFSAAWEWGSINDSGVDISSTSRMRCGYVKVIPGAVYTLSRSLSTGGMTLRGYDRDKSYFGAANASVKLLNGSTVTTLMAAGVATASFRVNDGVHYLRFLDYSNDLSIQYQMEFGEEATDYEEYSGEVAEFDFGQTVWGGALDTYTGVLTVTDDQIASYNGETLPGAWVSDRDAYAAGSAPSIGAQVVYKLASPQTVRLTPHRLPAQGDNTCAQTDGSAMQAKYSSRIALALEAVYSYVDGRDAEIGAKVDRLDEAVSSVLLTEPRYVDVAFDEIVTGSYMNPNTVQATVYEGSAYGALKSVAAGEIYRIRAKTGSNVRPYLLVDSTGTVVRKPDADAVFGTEHDYDVELTIADGEAGCTLYVNTLSTGWLGLRRLEDFTEIPGDRLAEKSVPLSKLEELPAGNPLYGKTAVFDGDSICKGAKDDTGLAWAGRIGDGNGMTWENFGRSGGTVCTDTYSWTAADTSALDWSANTYYVRDDAATTTTDLYKAVAESEWDGASKLYTRGSARHWESTNVEAMYAAYPDADYVILEACLNDGFNTVPIGSVPTSYTATVVTTNYAGAFEHMLRRALALFPRAKIGVIIPPPVRSSQPNAYHEIARAVCRKYSIPAIDLQRESGLCPYIDEQAAIMYGDATHPTSAGYDLFTPKIEAWMRGL